MPRYPQDPLIRRLFTRGQPLVFGKGEVILGNEPEPNGIYYIESGYVKTYTISDEGAEMLHIIYGSGELFPLVWAYLDVQPELLLYEALTTCTVWRIARDWFRQFIRTDIELSQAVATQLAQQFRIFADRVDNLEYKRAQERVAYRLLFLASRFGVHEGNTIRIDVPLTHETFANSINLARESVSREIERLEKEELVRKTNSHLILCDVAALATKLSRPINLHNWNLQQPSDASSSSPLYRRDRSQVQQARAAVLPQPGSRWPQSKRS